MLLDDLREWLAGAGRIVVLGVGHPLRMDDFVGVEIIRRLRGKVSERVRLIECEDSPESFLNDVIEFSPSHILIVDAGELGLGPGQVRLVRPEELPQTRAYSTHSLPLSIFCTLIARELGVKIALLLIQPMKTDLGEGLTPQVSASMHKIVDLLVTILQ
ncbi:MAG: hydrogenase maturation protease [Nitrososphaerota archaeon]|nr:hydrogenase maturation protease [Candidatus Bathyarchaeota archaeon]MDW8048059.1 hydrogenase maturation protease [Nitrososphaerota archaeon]